MSLMSLGMMYAKMTVEPMKDSHSMRETIFQRRETLRRWCLIDTSNCLLRELALRTTERPRY
jgi:hypothetical protein